MLTIRAATADDAADIARIYMESAEHHARLEPDRYWLPSLDTITAQYRERGRMSQTGADAITMIAELDAEVVGFVDVRLGRSPDPMHRDLTYCHIVEIAVAVHHQSQGIGERLLTAAEDWGRQRGAQLASLEFLAANTRASAFYQRRMGYRVAAMTAIKRLA